MIIKIIIVTVVCNRDAVLKIRFLFATDNDLTKFKLIPNL